MHNQVGSKSPLKFSFFSIYRQHFFLKIVQVLLPPRICILYKSLLPRTTTKITSFILNEIKRSISISVYYGWKWSLKYDCSREIDLTIIFCLLISCSPHSGTNKTIKWDMRLCILNIIQKYSVGTCLWRYWKLTLNTHFLLDFIYFQKTIDFSLSSVTSSHMQIWKIITKILDGVKVL
jgi:hypothetical protein